MTPARIICVAALLAASACSVEAPEPAAQPQSAVAPNRGAELQARLKQLPAGPEGTVAISVVHAETGETASLNADIPVPLYSVFKVPVALAVLEQVAAGKLSLDERIRITPEQASRGSQANSARWRQTTNRTIREFIELSLTHSDNTSVDTLIDRLGGAAEVRARLGAMGVDGIWVEKPVRDFIRDPGAHPNVGSAAALTRMLVRLHKGELLREPERALLLDFMSRQTTGERRLKGGLPAGTAIAAKTGTGPDTTNDIGLITLPGGGRVAIAVLVDRVALAPAEEERLIAGVARAAYEVFSKR